MRLAKIIMVFTLACIVLVISVQVWAAITVVNAFKTECKDGIAACAGRVVKEFNDAANKK